MKPIDEMLALMRKGYTSQGGFTYAAYLGNGTRICADCVREHEEEIREAATHDYRDPWKLRHVDIYWEGPVEECSICGAQLESEHGEPSNEVKGH